MFKLSRRRLSFLFLLIVCIGFYSIKWKVETVHASDSPLIGYAVLMVDSLNLGIRWDMTGGTSGEINRGEILYVYEERDVNGVHRYKVHAKAANIDGYVSAKYVEYVSLKKFTLYGFLKTRQATLYNDINCKDYICNIDDGEVFEILDMLNNEIGTVYYVYACTYGYFGYVYSNLVDIENEISEFDLFSKYAYYLNDAETLQNIRASYQAGIDALDGSNAKNFWGVYLSIWKKGIIDTVFDFGRSNYIEYSNSSDATITLVYGLMGDDNLVYEITSRIKEKFSNIFVAGNGMLEIEKEGYEETIKLLSEDIIDGAEDVYSNTIDVMNNIGEYLDAASLATEVVLSYIELNYMNSEILNFIEKNVETSSLLYRNVHRFAQNKKNLCISSDIFMDSIYESLVSAAKDYVFGEANPIFAISEFAFKIAGELLYNDSTDEYLQALYLSQYAENLGSALMRKSYDLVKKNVDGVAINDSDILNYKILYNMYCKSVEIFLSSVARYDEVSVKNAIEVLKLNCSYEQHIHQCINNVLLNK